MRNGSTSKRTKPDVTGTGGRNRPRVTGDVETRQDPSIGMAPPDEPRVKNPSYRQFQQYADQARRDQEKLRAQRDAARNPSGMDKDKIRSINKQITGAIDAEKRYTDAAQGKGTSTSAIVPMTKTTKKDGKDVKKQTNIGAYLNPKGETDSGKGGDIEKSRGGDLVKSNEKSLVSQEKTRGSFKKLRQLAKDEPVLGIAAYDLGKGILGKILKTRMPSLQARSGFRSAKGGGGL